MSSTIDLRERQLNAGKKPVYPVKPPPAFWDNLSEIPLTRNALRELDGRNKADSIRTQDRPPRRPITRRAIFSRKRSRISLEPAAQYLAHSNFARLKQIRRSARNGGPDLSDLRGYECECDTIDEASMYTKRQRPGGQKRFSGSPPDGSPASDSKRTRGDSTAKTKSTGPYDRAFQQHLINHSIYPQGYKYPDGQKPPVPGNLTEIKQEIRKRRASLSPTRFTEEDFEVFVQANEDAVQEWKVISTVVPIIEGEIKDAKCVSGQVPFTNLYHLTDGNLVAGNPDHYHGARPEQLAWELQEELSHDVIPSTQRDLPIAPNFLLAAKGKKGHLSVAEVQACYDGALGARAMHSLQTYNQEPVVDNNAYTITSTYHGATLKMYTTHLLPPAQKGRRQEYATTRISSCALDGGPDAFRAGATAYRNARDWAKKKRDEAIEKANAEFAKKAPLQGDIAAALSPNSDVTNTGGADQPGPDTLPSNELAS
ncbi:hypothetical protein F4777DRAFT_231216 [Nemania sp. FL0916]|nr:hypothetical protein F4777DRAFT_231216 [Nemania sp. FL0916]